MKHLRDLSPRPSEPALLGLDVLVHEHVELAVPVQRGVVKVQGVLHHLGVVALALQVHLADLEGS